MSEKKPKFVYVTYIAPRPEKLWQALTDPDLIEQYWFGISSRRRLEGRRSHDGRGSGRQRRHRDKIFEAIRRAGSSYALASRSTRTC